MSYKFVELCAKAEKNEVLVKKAESLGAELHFCSAAAKESEAFEGTEREVKNTDELKKVLKETERFLYVILKTDSQKAALRACKEVNVLLSAKLDSAVAKKITAENSFFELNLRSILTAQNSRERIRAIKQIKEELEILKKYKTKIVASYEPKSEIELRSARQMIELLKVFGLSEEEAKNACYKNAEEFLKMNRERLEGKLIQKGVRVVK